MQAILVGIAAGFAAALLFLAPVSGTLLAFPLFVLTGLPIGLAGLGWGVTAGAAAAVAGTLTVFAALSVIGAASFLLLFAAPVFWVARLALLSRPAGPDRAAGAMEWYPLGRMLLHLAAAVTVGMVLVGVLIGFDPKTLTAEVTEALVAWLGSGSGAAVPPTAAEIEPFVRFNVAVMPFTMAAILLFMLVFDLWLAAVVARASGRLARPRDKMWTVALPGQALAVLAVALLLVLLPGGIGEAARVAAGAFTGAAALTGLAVLHALTVGLGFRTPLLVVTYVLLLISGIPLFLFVLVAVAEAFVNLRARRAASAPPQ